MEYTARVCPRDFGSAKLISASGGAKARASLRDKRSRWAFGRPWLGVILGSTMGLSGLGCGASAAPASPAQAPETRAPETPAAPSSSVTPPTDPASARAPISDDAARPPGATPPPADSARTLEDVEAERQRAAPSGREITYRVTPQGLQVEAQGMIFKPRARAVPSKAGGWTIELTLEASSKDEIFTLLTPEHGPLSVAGYLQTKAGEKLSFTDARQGEIEELVPPGATTSFRRLWPEGTVWSDNAKARPAYWNEKVHLDVGLWGFGVAGERRLPVKKLFSVDMVAGAKPQPVVSPPQF